MTLLDNESLRFNTKRLNELEKSIMCLIRIENQADLPFRLPTNIKWPSGSRQKAERAMVLLREGYLSMQKKCEDFNSETNLDPKEVSTTSKTKEEKDMLRTKWT